MELEGLRRFINDVDSNQPAPGGGSVAALSGALGASLVRMVGQLTVTKKKYQTHDPLDRADFEKAIDVMGRLKERFMNAIEEDTEAFEAVMEAYRLPKSTDMEILIRKKSIEKASIRAIHVPLTVANDALEALGHLEVCIKCGNPRTMSDLGVGLLMFNAALEGALFNVKINLPDIDEIRRGSYETNVKEIKARAKELTDPLKEKLESLI